MQDIDSYSDAERSRQSCTETMAPSKGNRALMAGKSKQIEYPCICLSAYLSLYLSIYLPICLSHHPAMYLSVYLITRLSIYLAIYLLVSPSAHLSVCLFVRPSASVYRPLITL